MDINNYADQVTVLTVLKGYQLHIKSIFHLAQQFKHSLTRNLHLSLPSTESLSEPTVVNIARAQCLSLFLNTVSILCTQCMTCKWMQEWIEISTTVNNEWDLSLFLIYFIYVLICLNFLLSPYLSNKMTSFFYTVILSSCLQMSLIALLQQLSQIRSAAR